MAWCPNCKEEYREGFTNCADCGAELVAEIIIENTSKKKRQKNEEDKVLQQNIDEEINLRNSINPCLLISSSDQAEVKIIEGLLKSANIPFYTKDKGCGGYLKICMGYTVFGSDIYVDKSDYDDAMELISVFLTEIVPDEEIEILEDKDNRWFNMRKKVLKSIIYILIIFFSLGIIISFFNIVGYILTSVL